MNEDDWDAFWDDYGDDDDFGYGDRDDVYEFDDENDPDY